MSEVVDPVPLVRGRGRVKASITKYIKFANEITADTNLCDIELRLSRIDSLLHEFISYDDVLGDLVGYEHEFDDFEDKVMSLKSILSQEKNKRLQPSSQNTNLSTSSTRGIDHEGIENHSNSEIIDALTRLTESQQLIVNESARVKSSFETILPKINIKLFSGDYKDWPTFSDQFGKIHQDNKLSGIQKFTYLRSLLEPEPLLLIEKILLTNENYELAWNKLSKRYNNKRKIATSYIDTFFRQKPVKEGQAEEIRAICDNVENLLSGIDCLDPTKSRDIWLIHILLNKLDDNTKKMWAEKTTEMYEKNVTDGKHFPTMNEFIKFLDDRRITLESIQDYNSTYIKNRNANNFSRNNTNNNNNKVRCNFINKNLCKKCNLPHPLSRCFKFKQLTTQQKREFVSKNSLCFNCLNDGHRSSHCTYDKRCEVCDASHHSMLHLDKTSYANANKSVSGTSDPLMVNNLVKNKNFVPGRGQNATSCAISVDNGEGSLLVLPETNFNKNKFNEPLSANVQPFIPQGNQNMVENNNSNDSFMKNNFGLKLFDSQPSIHTEIEKNIMTCKASSDLLSLLPTAQVGVGHPDEESSMLCNILLDSGSQVSFITESLVNKLRLKRQKSSLKVNGLSSAGSVHTKGVVTLKLSSRYDNDSILIQAFILQNICSQLPAKFIDTSNWQSMNHLQLADRDFNCPKKLDILLGADQFFNILKPERLNVGLGMPTIQNTIFGWIVAGSFEIQALSFKTEITDESSLDETLKRFWEIEEISSQQNATVMTDEESHCENHFKDNYYINDVGKFVVKLPFNRNYLDLGTSICSATKRLLSLERRLSGDEELSNQYKLFMAEYIKMGHMKLIKQNEIKKENNMCYYLPHHPVLKPDSQTTRCRVVFDGSAKSQTGISLNDKLAVGPTIQQDLQSILINFRQSKIALCGDIEKMYRQIDVNVTDQDFQRILWRQNPNELCGAHLLTNMYSYISSLTNFKNIKITAFTDSSVVLSWLTSHPRRWKTFVANRTSQIINVIATPNWRHVKSKDNPADCASRGISPENLVNHELWWKGPPWLVQHSSAWPVSSVVTEGDVIENEARNKIYTFFNQKKNVIVESLLHKFSSLNKILRIICYCLRVFKLNQTKAEFLTSEELNTALKLCIKFAQQSTFAEEINLLMSKKCIPKKSVLSNLDAFVDSDGILRILGRLTNATCGYDTKHPFIIPKDHILGKLIVNQTHIKHLHAGPSLVSNIIRLKFWLIGGRSLVKKEISKCIICTRYRGVSSQQLMGDLPKERVTPGRAFLSTGLDYAGPFIIRWNKGRNPKTDKAYLALFVCLSTKAVHLELVSDLTSDAFIAALRRFIGRRGSPLHIFSDNGTNFVGAKRQLSSLYYSAFKDRNQVHGFLTDNFITWHMIPPAAPHFGGIWESGVKSAKFHLKRIMGDHILTFEELSTLFVQIESQLNSRPLTPMYENDAENLDILTPGHFLIGCPIVSLPEPCLLNRKLYPRDRWHLITKLQQDFWNRWSRDYLNTLQQRNKWHIVKENLKVGDLVLLKEDNLPPSTWATGRIQIIHPGADELVRVVTVKTAKTILKRPIAKLVKLLTD